MAHWDIDWHKQLQTVLNNFPLGVLRLIMKYEHLATWGKPGSCLTTLPTRFTSILTENFMGGWDSGYSMGEMAGLAGKKRGRDEGFVHGYDKGYERAIQRIRDERDDVFVHAYDKGYQRAMQRELPIAYQTGKKHGMASIIKIIT
jgi:hypothetical protein